MNLSEGYQKKDYGQEYVLLANGGHRAISDFLGNYVTLDTPLIITANKTFSSHLDITSANIGNLTVDGNASIAGLINLNNGFRIGTKEATSNNSYDAYTYIGPGDATNNNNLRIYLENIGEEGNITFGNRLIAYAGNIISTGTPITPIDDDDEDNLGTVIATIAGVPIRAKIVKGGENSFDVNFDTQVLGKTINVTGTNPVIGEFNFIDKNVESIYINAQKAGTYKSTNTYKETTNFYFCTAKNSDNALTRLTSYANLNAAKFIKLGRSADSNVLLADGRDITINNLLTSRTLTIEGRSYSVYSPNSDPMSLDSVYVRTANVDLDVDGVKTFIKNIISKKDIIINGETSITPKLIFLRSSLGDSTVDWSTYVLRDSTADFIIASCNESETIDDLLILTWRPRLTLQYQLSGSGANIQYYAKGWLGAKGTNEILTEKNTYIQANNDGTNTIWIHGSSLTPLTSHLDLSNYLPLTAGSTKSLTGDLYFSSINKGIYFKDSNETNYAAIYLNSSNLWIGAASSSSLHHVGQVYISSGWTDSSASSGNSTIKIWIPGNGGKDILHTGNAKWADQNVSTTSNSYTTPLFGEIRINNGLSISKYCRLIYDATNQCLKFIFV